MFIIIIFENITIDKIFTLLLYTIEYYVVKSNAFFTH